METINERIQWIIDTRYHGNKKRFASDIGVTPSTIDGIVGTRKSFPSYQVLRKISSILNISAEWLINGDATHKENNHKLDRSISLGTNLGSITNHIANSEGSQTMAASESTIEELKNIYETIIAELRAQIKTKDEQLKAKDEQLSKIIELLNLRQ